MFCGALYRKFAIGECLLFKLNFDLEIFFFSRQSLKSKRVLNVLVQQLHCVPPSRAHNVARPGLFQNPANGPA